MIPVGNPSPIAIFFKELIKFVISEDKGVTQLHWA
jgi:hypothetical protein